MTLAHEDRRQLVDELVAEALDLVDASARAEYLDRVCGHDQSLRLEVESLVAHAEQTGILDSTLTLRGLHPPELIDNRWKILNYIASGGMGDVYEAEDQYQPNRRRVALKAVKPEIATDPKMIIRFKQEVRIGQEVTDRNVCRVYDLGYHRLEPDRREMLYMTMELLRPGETLSKRIKGRRLSTEEAFPIIRQIVSGLSELHRAGYVHRDLKPANIMVVEQGTGNEPRVVITDLGLARRLVVGHTTEAPYLRKSGRSGTPEYMAPEQVSGGELSEATDIYALGVITYQMLTGVLPFTGATRKEIAEKRLYEAPPSLRSIVPELDPTWETVILKCLERDPGKRFASVHEVLDSTQPMTSEASPKPSVKAAFGAIPRWTWVSLMIVFLVLGVSIAGYQFNHRAPPAEARRWYSDGLAAMRDGTYFKALTDLRLASKLDPAFVLARVTLADAATELDLAEEAKEQILRSELSWWRYIFLSPVERLRFHAVRDFVLKDYSDAIDDLKKVLNQASEEDRPGVLVDLGRAYDNAYDIPNALNSYREAAGDHSYAAPALRLGILLRRLQNFPDAQAEFDAAQRIYRASSNGEGLTEVLYQRAVMYNKMNRPTEALPLLEEAIRMARTTSSVYQQIRALLQVSNALYVQGKPDLGEAKAQEAIELARANGIEALAASGLVDLGNALYFAGRDDLAQNYLHEAEQLAARFELPRVRARALVAIAGIKLKRGLVDESVADSREAVQYYTKAGYRGEASRSTIPIGRALIKKGDYVQARALFTNVVEIAKQTRDREAIALARDGLGMALAEQEQFPAALDEFRQTEALYAALGNHLGVGYAALHEGDALWRSGNYTDARTAFGHATAAARLAGHNTSLLASIARYTAEMNLSEHLFSDTLAEAARAGEFSKTHSIETSAELARIRGLALVWSGHSVEGLESCKQAEQIAQGAGDPMLHAMAKLALAEALLVDKQERASLEMSSGLKDEFVQRGKLLEAFWAATITIRANTEVGPASSDEYRQRAKVIVKQIQSSLGHKGYTDVYRRQDVQWLTKQAGLEDANK